MLETSAAVDPLRLATLACLRVLDTTPEERFDRITRIASALFQAPMAAINFVDATSHRAKSRIGDMPLELPCEASFCAYAVRQNGELLVSDTLEDSRFRDKQVLHAGGAVRFYAGVPLHGADGLPFGTLCILDTRPRAMSEADMRHLRDLAELAERELTTVELSEALLAQQEAEDALRISEERYRTVVNSLSEGVVLQHVDGSIHACNESAERILGLSTDQMMGRTSLDPRWRAVREDGSPFPGEEHPAVVTLSTGVAQNQVVMGVHKPENQLSWIAINTRPLFHNSDDSPYGVVSTFTDITARKQYERQLAAYQQQLELTNAKLQVLATTDGLTQVLNKRAFTDALDQAITNALEHDQELSLILLDVDQFKSFNDTFGHPAGDQVLSAVAKLLCSSTRSIDTVARYGGEEFAIIVPGADSDGTCAVAERLRQSIACADWPLRSITASFGVATMRRSHLSAEALVRAADQALYRAKNAGRNCVAQYISPSSEAEEAFITS